MRTALFLMGALAAGMTPQVPVGKLPFPEISALAASRRHPGVYWAIQDSGNPARLVAVWAAPGKPLRTRAIPVVGAPNVDWEEVAVDERGDLWIADTGNNAEERRDLALLHLAEPDPAKATAAKVLGRHPIAYPDAPPWGDSFDAESLFFTGGTAYVVTKTAGHGVYKLPRLTPGKPVTLERVAAMKEPPRGYGGLITAAALSRDGRRLAVVTGTRRVWVHEAAPGLPPGLPPGLSGDALVRDLASRPPRWSAAFAPDEAAWQVEAVSFAPGGHDVWLAAEEGPVWRFPAAFYEGYPPP